MCDILLVILPNVYKFIYLLISFLDLSLKAFHFSFWKTNFIIRKKILIQEVKKCINSMLLIKSWIQLFFFCSRNSYKSFLASNNFEDFRFENLSIRKDYLFLFTIFDENYHIGILTSNADHVRGYITMLITVNDIIIRIVDRPPNGMLHKQA